jgi:hypothetical protein
MSRMQRREVIAGVAVAAATGARAQPRGPTFEYLFVQLKPQSPRGPFLTLVSQTVRPLVTASGGEIVGLFTAQLGWGSNELAVLVRWPDVGAVRDLTPTLQRAPQVDSVERHSLEATVRPRPEDRLSPGGVYVHRWFSIRPKDREEFVRLSTEGWVDFEKRFDARIFGLMAETKARRDGTQWFLLLTGYGSHAVWEASRDPTTDAMKSFQRRAQLTLSSRGCSTLLTPLPA